MPSLVIYDIPSDRLRNKVADICLDYGLERIQYSAFLGEISRNRAEELLQKIKRRAGKNTINVQVFSICEKDMRLRKTLIYAGPTLDEVDNSEPESEETEPALRGGKRRRTSQTPPDGGHARR